MDGVLVFLKRVQLIEFTKYFGDCSRKRNYQNRKENEDLIVEMFITIIIENIMENAKETWGKLMLPVVK